MHEGTFLEKRLEQWELIFSFMHVANLILVFERLRICGKGEGLERKDHADPFILILYRCLPMKSIGADRDTEMCSCSLYSHKSNKKMVIFLVTNSNHMHKAFDFSTFYHLNMFSI